MVGLLHQSFESAKRNHYCHVPMGLHNKEYGMLGSVQFYLCSPLRMAGEWHSFLEDEFDEELNHYRKYVVFSKNLHVQFFQENTLLLQF